MIGQSWFFFATEHAAVSQRCQKITSSGGGLDGAGQGVQTAFTSNPAGLRSRLCKAAEEERAGQANPPPERGIADDPYGSTNKHTGVRYVYSSYCRGAVSLHKSGCQEEFVALPSTRLKEGRAHDKCALTDDLREQFLHGHALMIQRASLFM